MRYTLKDYQEDAVADVLHRLAWARDDWHQRKSPVAFSLTATTGAGKTVMAAAVIEALFNSNLDYDFDSDPGAVVLWFTNDPSLNEQTRFRLLDAADRITHSRLVVIENTFNRAKLEPGNVYFLNAQKLGKKSLLVRGAPENQHHLPMPDARAFTMWDTLANTIADEHLTLYLILDEAHRGMKPPSQSDRPRRPPSCSGSSTALTASRRFRSSGGSQPPCNASTRRWQGPKVGPPIRLWWLTPNGFRNLGYSRMTSGWTSPPRLVFSTPS